MSIIVTIRNSSQAWDLARDTYEQRGWTYPAFCELFGYMEEVAAGESLEFDPLGWACEHSFWETAAAYCKDCAAGHYAEMVEKNENGGRDSLEQLCLDYLAGNTVIIYSGVNGLVIEDF